MAAALQQSRWKGVNPASLCAHGLTLRDNGSLLRLLHELSTLCQLLVVG